MTHSHDSEVLRAAVAVLWRLGEAKRAHSVAGVLARLERADQRLPTRGSEHST